jgi:peptidoglycan/xylan/chitin deacetylase (PgdA/CDA1 family)
MRLPFVGRGGVLLYHRVADLANDPWGLAVTPANFAAQLALLARLTVPLALRELLARRAAGTLPANAVAVTFDDGYADNLETALPLLERHGIPATIFILTGFVGGREETWWDRLEQAVFEAPDLPESLEVELAVKPLRWRRPSDQPAAQSRADLHTQLYEALARLDTPDREAALAELAARLGRPPRLRSTHRPLDREQLHRLAAHPLVTIGAHTRSHPHLGRIAATRQAAELAGSKADLEAWLDRPVELIAYPHGSTDAATPRLAGEAGFKAGFTTMPRVVPHRLDPFRIPRLNIEDQGADQFLALLRWYRLARQPAGRSSPSPV